MSRVVVACLLVAIPASGRADSTEPATFPLGAALPPLARRPITEIDVYRDMADFWALAGMEQSVIAGGGVGYQHDSFATLDVAFHRKTFHSAWDLLPTTIASGTWRRDGHTQVPLAVGWQLQLGIFSSPYIVADAVTAWTPAASRLEAGFDAGVGYEWRASRSWAVDADFRLVGLWTASGSRPTMNESPWGVRALVTVRRYFGE